MQPNVTFIYIKKKIHKEDENDWKVRHHCQYMINIEMQHIVFVI